MVTLCSLHQSGQTGLEKLTGDRALPAGDTGEANRTGDGRKGNRQESLWRKPKFLRPFWPRLLPSAFLRLRRIFRQMGRQIALKSNLNV